MSSPPSPRSFGRYQVLRPLGRGAVGEVYLAHDPVLGRQVAIKTLSGLDGLPPVEREEARARFLREARAAAGLSHPHIVTIHDVGEQDGIPFLAMEYLEATPLDRHTRTGHLLPPAKVLELGIQAALALEEAHRHGLVHRDVKPGNLALLADGTLKVVDFGLAKGLETTLTAAETLLGTPNYMSPEQVAGKPLDGRTDLFSLGVSLFELLTGQRPFGGDTVSSVLYRIVNDTPQGLAELRDDLSPALDRLLTRVLAKEPADRPASAGAFAGELGRILADMGGVPPQLRLPPPAAPAAAAPMAAIGWRRRRRGASAFVALALILLGSLSLTLWGGAVGRALGVLPRDRTVSVETDPPGLEVKARGGAVRFLRPGVLLIPAGETAAVSLEAGDECRMATTALEPDEAPDRVRLVAAPRVLGVRVDSDPAGASVALNGEPQPVATPCELLLTACQAHAIDFRAPGRETVTVRLGAREGAADWQRKLSKVLLPAVVAAQTTEDGQVVTEAPPGYGAEIQLSASGKRIGVAGGAVTLPAGEQRLVLVNPQVALRREIAVRVSPGRSVRPAIAWPQLGWLTVRAAPPGGRVLVRTGGGALLELGVTPLNRAPIVEGNYELVIEHPTHAGQVMRSVVVQAGAETPLVRVGEADWR